MNEEQLIETFEKGLDEFLKYKWNDPRLMIKLTYESRYSYEPFMEEFHDIYSNILNIRKLVLQIQNNINSELSFHSEQKTSKVIINLRMEKIAKKYMKNPYNIFANSENILYTLFEPENYMKLSRYFWRDFIKKPDDFVRDRSIRDVLNDQISSLTKLIAILIENILLKVRLQELNTNRTISSFSENMFTRNQTVLLFDRLGFLNNMENYSNVSKAKLISIISGYGYDNIKKSIEALEKPPKDQNKQYKEDSNTIEAFIQTLS